MHNFKFPASLFRPLNDKIYSKLRTAKARRTKAVQDVLALIAPLGKLIVMH